MSLAEYRKKRSFNSTPEPRDTKAARQGTQLHFVVQKHDASRLHYDFRLELDGVLKSWAVPKGPSQNPKDKRLAMMVEDHPLSYADFEGVIPEGQYGAGDVIVWDRGVYMSAETADLRENRKQLKAGIQKGELKIVLYGEKLKGGFALIKMRGRGLSAQAGKNAWLLVKERDEYAYEGDITEWLESVKTGKVLPRDAKTQKTKKKK